MSGSGRVGLPDVRRWSEGPRECPGVVGRALGMFGSCREALEDVLEWPGGPPGSPGVVGRPSRMSGSGRGPPSCSGVVGRTSRMSVSGRVALPDVREWSRDPPGFPRVARRPFWKSGSGR